ncbi:MAG: hypothetical protein WDM89_08305 [Rhizomicrobium sp.]
MTLAQRAIPTHERRRPGPPANDNRPQRRVVVNLSPHIPISRTEVEVVDLLIGSFADFTAVAANDNERPDPNPGEIRGPPMRDD